MTADSGEVSTETYLLDLSGQLYARSHFDLGSGRITLEPQTSRERLALFFSVEGAWRVISVDATQVRIDLGSGRLTVREPTFLPG